MVVSSAHCGWTKEAAHVKAALCGSSGGVLQALRMVCCWSQYLPPSPDMGNIVGSMLGALSELRLLGKPEDGFGALASALASNATVRVLELRCLDNDGAALVFPALANNTTLQRLILNCIHLDFPGINALAAMVEANTALVHLALSTSYMTNLSATAGFLQAVAANTALQELVLQGTRMKPGSASHVVGLLRAKTPALRLLDFNSVLANMGQNEVHAIADALGGNVHLEELDLRSSDITLGSGSLRLALALASRPRSLRVLKLSHNLLFSPMGPGPQASHVAEALGSIAGLCELHLRSVGLTSDVAGKFLASLAARHSEASPLALRLLDISYNEIGDLASAAVGDLLALDPGLRELRVGIADAGAEAFADGLAINSHLHVLELDHRSALSAAAIILEGVRANKSLRALTLPDSMMAIKNTEAAAEAYVAALVRVLRENDTLAALSCPLYFDTTDGFAPIYRALQRNVTLRKLRLFMYCHFSIRSEWKALARVVAKNTVLESLDLTKCSLPCEAIEDVARALRANATLRELNLGVCGGDGGDDFRRGAKNALASAALENKSLESLSLRFRILGPESAVAKFQALAREGCTGDTL